MFIPPETESDLELEPTVVYEEEITDEKILDLH